MVTLQIALWNQKGHLNTSKVHARFDYAVAHGAGTLCGKRIPAKAVHGSATQFPVTCKKCLEQLGQI